jgi:hypothetical protein
MSRMIIGLALALAACAHSQPQSGVTTTSATILPREAQSTPVTAPEPQRSFDALMDPGATPDGRISDSIYAGILADRKLGIAAQEIDVTTRDGNVVLSGRVHTDAERDAIVEKAHNTAGVKSVDDRLEVQP